jgi:predicted Zn-dependent protease with MMP-like domain
LTVFARVPIVRPSSSGASQIYSGHEDVVHGRAHDAARIGAGDGGRLARSRAVSRGDVDRGWRLLDAGDVAGARRAARHALQADPAAPEALLLTAACERHEGRPAEAEGWLRRAAEADREWATPVLWLAEILAEDPDRQTEALRHARRAADLAGDDPEAWLPATVLAARLALEGGDEEAAREALGALPPADVPLAPPDLALDVADLFLALDDAPQARTRYRALTAAHPDLPDAWYGLGLAAQAEGDDAGAGAAWLEALRRDVETPLDERVARLSEEEFAEVAEDALAELPERARALLEDVPILVVDAPSEEDVRQGLDPRILGLFSGMAYPDHSSVGGAPHLTQILLFRRNLERVAGDVDELREEIRITLVHETGHFFGLSEDELHEMGLG